MSKRQAFKRTNRYKDGGKGGKLLAVFILFLFFILATTFYFFNYSGKYQLLFDSNSTSSKQQQFKLADTVAPLLSSSKMNHGIDKDVNQSDYKEDVDPEQHVVLPPAPTKNIAGKKTAKLAILVDDMGGSIAEAHALAAIGTPLSFAVIPGLRHDREVAIFAAGEGIDVLIHIPMQAKGYPLRRLESNGLLLEHTEEELQKRVLEYTSLLPQAKGANNHMGSAFTENSDKMRIVLKVLKSRGMFFVDSITTSGTTGLKVAAELKIPSARRDVFLDNEQDETYIKGQLLQAVTRAKKNGTAIAICHPHPETINSLAKNLPELKKQGVALVRISEVI